MSGLSPFLYVALGGALGAMMRYAVVQFFAAHWLAKYHVATLLVNTLGSFLMVFFMTLFMMKFAFPLPLRLFFAAGFLGSFTTFSTFSYETIHLFTNGYFWQALVNVLLNNTLSIGAGVLGLVLARSFSS